ncbi:flagellar basal body-associated FliL family protein [Candidatus Phycosocius spiralis]|uniref:Flagellar protein FliL n=1 Tax=Candidatus Phycosocius spiralis TaxID=2815099 RepID=A0ABQ4PXM4_9PROT|nr:flagellar basal body-associated FliL family protein [Candidatus Phycosocius spiralis]GIU67443.1 flagellar FliL protein [Candidatus Phycosocius spiralis]
MADEADKKDDVAADAEGSGKKKLAGKQLILFIVLPVVVLLGGGAAAYFLLFNKPATAESPEKTKDKAKENKEEKKGAEAKGGEKGKEGQPKQEGGIKISEGPNGEGFMTVPDVIVNIVTSDARPVYLKLRLTLQTKDTETAETIRPLLPRILDQFTGFLRELRAEDIAGSAGYSRLQLELLKRVNLAVAPAQVDDVLIEEMLVQ